MVESISFFSPVRYTFQRYSCKGKTRGRLEEPLSQLSCVCACVCVTWLTQMAGGQKGKVGQEDRKQ